MTAHFHPEVIALLTGALLCAFAAVLAWGRRAMPGSVYFTAGLIACTVWSLTEAADSAAISFEQKVFWAKLAYFGISALPAFWFLFALHYQARKTYLKPAIVATFFLIPAATTIAVLTNEYHHLIWSNIIVQSSEGGNLLYEHGPLFWVHVFYSYLLLISGTFLLVRGVIRQQTFYKQQAFTVIIGIIFPILGNAFYLAGWTPIRGLDPTPFFFGISGLWIMASLSQRRLFDLAPVAREVLVERMTDGFLIFDEQERLIDINPAARKLLCLPASGSVGQSLDQLLLPIPELQNIFTTDVDTVTETELSLSSEDSRSLAVRSEPLQNLDSNRRGRVLIMSDLTAQRRMEKAIQDLQTRNEVLSIQNQQFQEQIRAASERDPLTGLYNRRYLMTTLSSFLPVKDTPVSMILIGLDHFKLINDRFGHLIGDAVLIALADMLAEGLMSREFACRYSSKQFMVVLPGVSLKEVERRCQLWYTQYPARVARIAGSQVQATFSSALIIAPEHGNEIDSLLLASQTALARAKQEGGNRPVTLPVLPPVNFPQPTGEFAI